LVYTLCNIEGLRHKEVAEKLEISPLTVKVHLREAIKNLKKLVGDNPNALLILIFLGIR
jgi:RNA polymerase sigma-70 factor (ECF subfamily)